MTSLIDPEVLLAQGLSPKTAYVYIRILARSEAFLADRGVDLETASPDDIRALAATFPRSHSSLTQLRGALRHAWEALGVARPPVWAIRAPKRPAGRCRALSEAEAAALEREARRRGDRPGLAVLVGLHTALRRSEIARLHTDDLRDDCRWLRVVGKGDVSADIPVHPAIRAELRNLKSGYAFPGSRRRDHVSPATVWSWTRDVASSAGVPDVTTHRLRHTALAEALDRSHDLRTVQAFARHAKPETTAIYTRVRNERLAEVVGMISYRRDDRAS